MAEPRTPLAGVLLAVLCVGVLGACDGSAQPGRAVASGTPEVATTMTTDSDRPTDPTRAAPSPPSDAPATPSLAPQGAPQGPPATPPEGSLPRSPAGLEVMPLLVKGERFLMEKAMTEQTRQRGLGGRSSLEPDRGMLFAYRHPEVMGFWMRDCLIDLDIAYLDVSGRVVAVHRMRKEPPRAPGESTPQYLARLPSYSSRRPAAIALEFAAGTLDRLDLRPGELIELDVTALRREAQD